ncbi:hypothetical protein [Kurthia sibirica]|uniref:Uncharacterized protein n=1 Tax=Kurthia sibirica TaxID=202750 RepID=A0A2U3ANH1_9BACL|nr:hypothetical protein [Kurthia sibirica]PWI26078.1 hypothetical protein DEX24_05985 [Kurthia sibirica]GEK34771.1 hypothetical protein KSI01_23040 [Kurthia sibirica]
MDIFLLLNIASIIVYIVVFLQMIDNKRPFNKNNLHVILVFAIGSYFFSGEFFEGLRGSLVILILLIDIWIELNALKKRKSKQ